MNKSAKEIEYNIERGSFHSAESLYANVIDFRLLVYFQVSDGRQFIQLWAEISFHVRQTFIIAYNQPSFITIGDFITQLTKISAIPWRFFTT